MGVGSASVSFCYGIPRMTPEELPNTSDIEGRSLSPHHPFTVLTQNWSLLRIA